METLWPRDEPLLAGVTEPARSARTGCGSQPAHPSGRRSPGLARPGVPALRGLRPHPGPPAGRAVALLEGWLRLLSTWVLARATVTYCDLGAPGTHRSTACSGVALTPAAARRRAVPARVKRKGFHVRRHAGGPGSLPGAGRHRAAGPFREPGGAGPGGALRRRRPGRPQAPPTRFAGRAQPAPTRRADRCLRSG